MNGNSGRTTSAWMEKAKELERVNLSQDLETEVCIVGAGISGLSVAYTLARQGTAVLVLDDGPIGGGETSRTTAHLSNALDDRYFLLESMHGEDGARQAAESHTAAIREIEAIVSRESIECDFVRLDGYLFVMKDDAEQRDEFLERELAAAHKAGLTGVERLERVPIEYNTGGCLRFPGQAQFHPLKYLTGLAQAIERYGGNIFTGAHVTKVTGGKDARVETADGRTVRCRQIVVATNSPINDRVTIHTKQSAYRTYVVALDVPHGSVPLALYWDGFWHSDTPYHYVRLQQGPSNSEPDLLIVGVKIIKRDRKKILTGDTRSWWLGQGNGFRWRGRLFIAGRGRCWKHLMGWALSDATPVTRMFISSRGTLAMA